MKELTIENQVYRRMLNPQNLAERVMCLVYIEAFPEVDHVYSDMNEESKFMVRMYSEGFRGKSI